MTTTISRLYNSHAEARAAVRDLEATGVSHGDISIVASNADNWYDAKNNSYPDRDLDGKDDRAEGAATGGGIGALAGGTAGLLTGLGMIAIPRRWSSRCGRMAGSNFDGLGRWWRHRRNHRRVVAASRYQQRRE